MGEEVHKETVKTPRSMGLCNMKSMHKNTAGPNAVGPTARSRPGSAPAAARPTQSSSPTVLLSFISFWRAAAIVLADLGSSRSMPAASPSRRWAGPRRGSSSASCSSWAVRAVYIEARVCSFGRRLPRREGSHGRHMAKLSVSALLFDYVLTGPSAPCRRLYIAALSGEVLGGVGSACAPDRPGSRRSWPSASCSTSARATHGGCANRA